jgi:thioesterase domain-containing protein
MEPRDLQKYLHDHIPISAAIEVEVVEVGRDGVVLRAPLEPNINHRETVFGGSASAVAILAAWSLVHIRLREAGVRSRVVIQRNTQDHDLPIHGSFTARSFIDDPLRWDRFMKLLEKRGRARVAVSALLEFEGQVAGRFEGTFVALTSYTEA